MSEIPIRPATRNDAAHLAVVVDMASEGMASHMWRDLAGTAESPVMIGRARALREDADFSYRNGIMAEIGGQVVGGMVGFVHGDAPPPPDLPPMLRGLVDLGREIAGYWYVNVLAVYPEFRGKGIGGRLLAEADVRGRAAKALGMALIVASGNEGARRLYERVGYRLRSGRPSGTWPKSRTDQEWWLLTKPIGAG